MNRRIKATPCSKGRVTNRYKYQPLFDYRTDKSHHREYAGFMGVGVGDRVLQKGCPSPVRCAKNNLNGVYCHERKVNRVLRIKKKREKSDCIFEEKNKLYEYFLWNQKEGGDWLIVWLVRD